MQATNKQHQHNQQLLVLQQLCPVTAQTPWKRTTCMTRMLLSLLMPMLVVAIAVLGAPHMLLLQEQRHKEMLCMVLAVLLLLLVRLWLMLMLRLQRCL